MRNLIRFSVPFLAVAALAFAGCSNDTVAPLTSGDELAAAQEQAAYRSLARGRAVIANRGSGSISVIDAKTHAVVGTYMLPVEGGEPTPEPMYVVYTPQHQRVFVGDRANNRVAVFDARSFDVEGTVPAGAGVFHMWADGRGKQFWVNNDIDNTTTVFDPKSLEVIATVPTPADLVAMGGKPHDVILDHTGDYAYVSVLGLPGDSDYVVQFDARTFEEMARAAVGKDPHLSLARQSPWLFVPCQESDQVVVLDRMTLALETTIDVPGAHGAGMAGNGRFFYTTNLTGGGDDALFAIDTEALMVVGEPADAPYAVPHNIALTANNKKLFVTHSGPTADKVTIYETPNGPTGPVYVDEVTVGLNPFGLTFVR